MIKEAANIPEAIVPVCARRSVPTFAAMKTSVDALHTSGTQDALENWNDGSYRRED
jgi:hypothetical protein